VSFIPSILEISHVKKDYMQGNVPVQVLKGINLQIMEKTAMGIMGVSGSGKTTLLNLIGGLDRITSGKIYFKGLDLSTFTEKELARYRMYHIGFIFQKYNLIPVLTVEENIELPLIIAGDRPREERKKIVARLLVEVGLEERANNNVNKISGGERQRAAIARALVNEPSLVLADEPTGNLDNKTGQKILDLLKKEAIDNGTTLVIVSHDLKVVKVVDKVVWIENGRITEDDQLTTLDGLIIA
jgi:putative ABC transport system ATP-binding protein